VRLKPLCEVILCGDEEGVAARAKTYGIKHILDVRCNEYGMPLLDSVFEEAQEVATTPVMWYVNADIILFDDLIVAVRRTLFQDFLAIGSRWDVDVAERLDWNDPACGAKVRSYVETSGIKQIPWAIDYFVFPRGSPLGDLPPFAVGRAGWDNWLISRALRLTIPVVDLTQAVMAVHQNQYPRCLLWGLLSGMAGVQSQPETCGQRGTFVQPGECDPRSYLQRSALGFAEWIIRPGLGIFAFVLEDFSFTVTGLTTIV